MKKLISILATAIALTGVSAFIYGIYQISPPVAISTAGAFLLFIALLLELLSLKVGKR